MRQEAAGALQIPADQRTPDHEDHIEDLLDFFETLGLLTRRRALDKEMVWSTFFYWLYGYWLFSRAFVEAQRAQFPARYGDLVWLIRELTPIERHMRGALNDAEWNNFLAEESAPQ
jgi:hypothetical protein